MKGNERKGKERKGKETKSVFDSSTHQKEKGKEKKKIAEKVLILLLHNKVSVGSVSRRPGWV